MAWHLLVFALTGLAFVVLAWFVAPGTEEVSIPTSAGFGVVGSLLGGLAAWYYWPTTDGEFNYIALLTALLGAGLLFWAYRSYAQFSGADE